MTIDEVNACIVKITHNNSSHLCCKIIKNHIQHHFDTLKYSF
jgi:hypothetical protein